MERPPKIAKKDMHLGCATCSNVQQVANMDMVICVGFGSAFVTKDGEMVYDGERDFSEGREPKSLADIELMALADRGADWRVVLHGPLHGETYQRRAKGKWVMIESNEGFA